MDELEEASSNVSQLALDPSEDSLANAFAEMMTGKAKFNHTDGKWYLFKDGYWQRNDTLTAFHYARIFIRKYNQKHKDKTLPKLRVASAVEKFAQADPRCAILSNQLNTNNWLLGTPKGTVDLRTGEMLDNNPDHLITKQTLVSPINIKTSVFDSTLMEITNNDESFIRYLMQIFGMCLTGDISEQIIIFIYGPGGNGKSLLIDMLSNILNDYAATAGIETFTSSKYDRHSTELARLDGPRLVSASETEEGRAWAQSRIKTLTGGGKITARYMRKDDFEFTPKFKLIFTGNHKPSLRNVDEAERRRFHIVPFLFLPKKPDKDLPKKLELEYSGILAKLIHGCIDWQRNGIVMPDVVKAETQHYFDDQDIFSQWLDELIIQGPITIGESGQALYKSWVSYTQSQGEDSGNYKDFRGRIEKAGFKPTKNVPGQHGTRGFLGLQLKTHQHEATM